MMSQRHFPRLSASSLIIGLAIYYLIIFAHWDFLIKWLLAILGIASVMIVSLVIALVSLVPVSVKFMGAMKGIFNERTVSILRYIILLAIGVFIVISRLEGWDSLSQSLKDIVRSPYLAQYQGFWIMLLCGLFYLFLFERIRRTGQVYEFLDSFKAFPLVSPVFCFGAPAFWNQALGAMGITNQAIQSLNVVSFLCGIIFLIALILYYVFRHLDQHRINQQTPGILLPYSMRKPPPPSIKLRLLPLYLLMIGLTGITYVSIEIAYLVSLS